MIVKIIIFYGKGPSVRLLILRFLLLLLLILPAKVWAANMINIVVPDKVGVGKPFLVHITSQNPMKNLTVSWNDKTVKPSVTENDGQFKAMAILGVGLKSEIGEYPLIIIVNQLGSTQQFSNPITVVNSDFQNESLIIDPSLVTPPKEVKERIQIERKATLEALNTISVQRHWTIPFSRPVKGKMLSRFGLHRIFNGETKRRHKGLDFRAWEGTPINCMAAGHVILVGKFYFAGNCVFIDHGNGLVSFSGHMSKVLVKKGDFVVSGQNIGLSGATGRVSGAHLHLSVFTLGMAIDPEPFFDGSLSLLY